MNAEHNNPTKLKLSTLPLVGREKELDELQQVCDRVRRGRIRQRPADYLDIVLIEGPSGNGKSALVAELIKRLEKRYPDDFDGTILFCSGKFNQTRSEEPYFALRQAFEELCDSILNMGDREELLSSLKEAVGRDAKILTDAIPALRNLLGDDLEQPLESQDSRASFNRLKYLFQVFLRIICQEHQVILFIDDLQWADGSTLEILESILMDSEAQNLMFIGAFRNEDSDLTYNQELVELLNKLKDYSGRVSRIELEPLTEDSINKILNHLIKLESSETMPLATVIQRKTHGNPFIVMEFLQQIVNEKYLEYSVSSFQWVIKLDQIKEKTFLAESIVDVVAARLRLLPSNVQKILTLCACLWSKFEVGLLFLILSGLDGFDGQPIPQSIEDLKELLHVAVKAELMEDLGRDNFKFAHDRIQQSAYSFLIDEAARHRFHYQLGLVLLNIRDTMPDIIKQNISFLVVDQLNLGSSSIVTKNEKDMLAAMNLEAGKKAKKLSAFYPAWTYLVAGIDLLEKNDKWTEHYDLTIDLYTNAVDMASCLGYYESCSTLSDEALANAKSMDEKTPIFISRVSSLGQEEKFDDAMALTRKVLSALGESMPKKASTVHLLLSVVKTSRLMKGRSDEEILSLPRLVDGTKVAAMKLLSLYAVHTLMAKKTNDLMLSLVRLNLITLKYGLSNNSPSALSFYAIVVSALGHIDEGNRLCKLAMKMISHLNAFQFEADVLHNYGMFNQHWRKPYTECMTQMLVGYKSGMTHGEIEFAFYCGTGCVVMYHLAGLPLLPVEKDCQAYCNQMVKYGRQSNFHLLRSTWQLLLNLVGKAKDPFKLSGDAMEEESFVKLLKSNNNIGALQTYWINKGQSAYYFGDYEEAERVLVKFGKTKANLATHIFVSIHAYFYALTVLALARTTKKSKYRFAARRAIKVIKKWVDQGSINHAHKLLLLNSEFAALTCRDAQKVRTYYDAAIVAASRAGFMNDAAIASERAGICLLGLGDKYWASEYLNRAHRLYTEWGALGVSKCLLSKYSSVLHVELDGSGIFSASTRATSVASFGGVVKAPPTRQPSTYHKGREHYDPSPERKHAVL